MKIQHIPYKKKSDKSYWDNLSMGGQNYQHGQRKHRQHIMDMIVKYKISKLLDVGCGTGPIMELLAETHTPLNYYKGVDYSKGLIKTAKTLFPHADFEVQDARKLKEKDDSYDLVLLMHILDHVDRWRDVIKEAKRVSRKYIQIILWRMFAGEPHRVFQIVMHDTLWHDSFLHEYRQEDLEAEFKKQGLKIVHQHEVINEDTKYNYCWFLEK